MELLMHDFYFEQLKLNLKKIKTEKNLNFQLKS